MLVAHIPAGYLATQTLLSTPWARRLSLDDKSRRVAFAVALFASIAPDLDLFWFYFVDGRSRHHHHYFPHLPLVWVAAGLTGAVIATALGATRARALIGLATLMGLLHCLLDTLVGHIKWAWPWSQKMMAAFEVPARYSHWILNFIFHWSFGLEIIVVGVAVVVFMHQRRRRAEAAIDAE